MKEELNKYVNEIPEISNLPDTAYENIFKVYKEDNFFAFNILKTVQIPANLHEKVYDIIMITGKTSWTKLSFDQYGSINLWWLICLTNGILNPTSPPVNGMMLKIIRKEFVSNILDEIKLQVNNS